MAYIFSPNFQVATLSWPRVSQPGNVSITAVDGLPGPVIEVYEGDTVVVHVINDSPRNVTIHWYARPSSPWWFQTTRPRRRRPPEYSPAAQPLPRNMQVSYIKFIVCSVGSSKLSYVLCPAVLSTIFNLYHFVDVPLGP
jgi:hypothetical protein